MHPKASTLLDAHTQYIMSQLGSDNVAATLERETNAFLDWAAQRPLASVISVERIQDFAVRYVLDQAPTESLRQQIVTLVNAALQSPLNAQTEVNQLLEHKTYLAAVDKIATHEQLKKDLIHAAVANPVYAKLLSDVVYHALSDYLLHENPLAKKVPGVSSLMKMGKGLMESAGNGAIEAAIKSYLHKNMQNIVDLSEKVLVRTLDAKQIHHVADQIWHRIEKSTLATGQQYLKEGDIDFVSQFGVKVWNHFRQTDYAQGMLKELIGVWFAQNGGRDGLSLLADLNIDREELLKEVQLFAQPVIAEMLASGFIEQRVREQLSGFYGQDSVGAVFEGA